LSKAGLNAKLIKQLKSQVTVASAPAAAEHPKKAAEKPEKAAKKGEEAKKPEAVKKGEATAPGKPVDLNTATQAELEGLKGVGPANAKKIIAGRPYKSVDDLAKAGISAKLVKELKPQVTVGAAPAAPAAAEHPKKAAEKPEKAAEHPKKAAEPAKKAAQPAAKEEAPAKEKPAAAPKLAPGEKVNLNTATKEKLEALPEIGPVKAQAIIDGRPYTKIEDVMKVKGIKEETFKAIKDFITVK
jgi:competence protein ComEA